MVSRNRNIFLRGAACARTAAFLLASVLVWTHARAQAPEERYKIVNGVRTRIVVSDSASTAKADTVAITQQSLSPVELDTTTTARQRRQLARMARDTSSVRYSKLFRDTMPISRVCWISAVAPASANCITNRHGRYRFCTDRRHDSLLRLPRKQQVPRLQAPVRRAETGPMRLKKTSIRYRAK